MNSIPTGNASLCISIAAKPGRFGITVHNAGYRALGLNYFYRAFKVDDIEGVIAGVRALGIRGCSVSMPFKETVMPYLDDLDATAQAIGAVNTIVNNNNKLIGYNTDVIGVREVLLPYMTDCSEPVLVLGTGGAARAILKALSDLNMKNITLCGRNHKSLAHLADLFKVTPETWEARSNIKTGILINATPIGMSPEEDALPIDENQIASFRLILDMVSTPLITRLIRLSRDKGVSAIQGSEVALHQAFAQFFLYTGVEPPRKEMAEAAQKLYKDTCLL